MPSPFPGMDPFIEDQEWEDFHTTLNTVIRECLSPKVEPNYLVRIERRVYVETAGDPDLQFRQADVAVLTAPSKAVAVLTAPSKAAHIDTPAAETSTATAWAPVTCELPMSEERRETFLVIRERRTMDVVTVIEPLSPANKRTSGNGRAEYLAKRKEILQSRSHLVELDFLRGGERLPIFGSSLEGEYSVIISRVGQRPQAAVFAWSRRQPLPEIPIPLNRDDPDATLDLQSVFTTVYDRARYELSLDYQRSLRQPIGKADRAWVDSMVPDQHA
ncbi:MAG: DUF4058 family protein [Planctomycetota bacterium]|nr:DUF4058 family protein [Planctomycetota bacterium]